jgi:hypothetical protein
MSFTVTPGNSTTFAYETPEVDDSSSISGWGSSSSYDFDTSYSDGTYAEGKFFNDVIALGNVSFDHFTVGLVNYTDRYIGVLGLGYNDTTHSTFVDRLVDQSLINSAAYSIWVDDSQASSGNILFGAIDTTKFEGNLSRVSSSYAGETMLMMISSINATTKDSADPISITYDSEDDYYGYGSGSSSSYGRPGSSEYMFRVNFAPTDSFSVLPADVVSQIWEVAGAYFDSSSNMALIGCNAGTNDGSTNFTFRLGKGDKGPIISTTMEDLIVPLTEVDLRTYSSSFSSLDSDTCLFGVQNTSSMSYYSSMSSYSTVYSLGSGILRRTYSVLDFANDEIAIAPVKFSASETSNIVPFASYGSAAPSSTMDCTASYCSRSSSGGSRSGSGGSDDDGEDGLGAGILTLPALLGTVLGVGLGSLFLGIAGFLIWRHRRNKKLTGSKDVRASVSSAEAGESAAPEQPAQQPVAAGAAPAPEMTQASQQAPPGSAKGKAPEIPMPENLASASGDGHAHGVDESQPPAASSSRNA